MRIAFAGDRDIAVSVLRFIQSQQVQVLALLLPDPQRASHNQQLTEQCSFLPSDRILLGTEFRKKSRQDLLRKLQLDFIIMVHFPYIIPPALLDIPHEGILNLHPGFLPYNKGWHTPSWALLEQTPIGATIHFMDPGIDSGAIVDQKLMKVSEGDTAHTLYRRLKALELEVFKEAWPRIVSRSYELKPQKPNTGTFHKREELFQKQVQKIDLDQEVKAGDLLRRLRALTTNQIEEAAFYESNGRQYRVQVVIREIL